MIKKPNFIFIVLVSIFVVVEILILRPTNIETGEESAGMFSSIETMIEAQKVKDEVGYTIDGFHYTAVEGEIKQWELLAREAILYEKSRMVHAKEARIRMFDPVGKVTLIEGDAAQYRMGVRDMDLQGNVKVTFPDGFWLKTAKAHYEGTTGKITSREPVYGEANVSDLKGETMQIWGIGFEANKLAPDVFIREQAHVRMHRADSPEATDVRSDQVRIDRFTKVAYFSMAAGGRFVESKRGTLHVKSRRQEATYDADARSLKFLTAYEDVLIRETDAQRMKTGLKYATSQKAEFYTKEDKILLSGFPSAYQEQDTLTGELIVIYRGKNLVEVTHANAYHEGTQR